MSSQDQDHSHKRCVCEMRKFLKFCYLCYAQREGGQVIVVCIVVNIIVFVHLFSFPFSLILILYEFFVFFK